MSPAEIEDVRRFWTDEGGDFSATGLRLLEERERLLEALRPIAGEAFVRQRPGWEPEHDKAVRALAFAEAPSGKP